MTTHKNTKQLIRLCRRAKVSLYIWGSHGLGKSSIVKQVAEEDGLQFIDYRLSQIESLDLRGCPGRTEDGRTRFYPPTDLPSPDSNGPGLIFLDECNRGDQATINAAFQLVLDRRIGEYVLPDGWSIVCAGNFDDGNYTVNSLDPALVDRFLHVVLSHGEPTFSSWVDWMTCEFGDQAAEVIGFCGANLQHLEVVESTDLGFEIQPSRRSWAMATRILNACKELDVSEEVRIEALAGLIGRELAISFTRYKVPFQPTDLIAKGVKRYAARIHRLSRQKCQALMWGLISHVKHAMPDESVAQVALDFAELLLESHKDLAMAYCSSLAMESITDKDGLSREQCLALLKNRLLTNAFADVRRERRSPKTFIDRLNDRNALADSVAQAMTFDPSITSSTSENCQ